MRRLLAAATLAALTAAVAPAAQASATGETTGGCFFVVAAHDTLTTGPYVGVLGDVSLTTNPATHEPVQATVSCQLRVNGVVQNTTDTGSWAGFGAQAGVQQAIFSASTTAITELCQRTVYATPPTTDDWTCRAVTSAQVPPADITNDLLRALVDPVLCPVLRTLHGAYGPVVVAADGDVTVDGQPLYDCAPYRAKSVVEQTQVRLEYGLGPTWPV
jgi:hypothetical protein